MAAEEDRVYSFTRWPHGPLYSLTITPVTLATYGFRHAPITGAPDNCICCGCNANVANWKSTDKIPDRHPNCNFHAAGPEPPGPPKKKLKTTKPPAKSEQKPARTPKAKPGAHKKQTKSKAGKKTVDGQPNQAK
eukprot:TRINITY_DN67675_c2_g1_i10.p2 TRINITY_DN67675_c2_g1~~TRINITY_DN67675_c2_g1_i10.p2  ORF type:complete len:134 (+),score=8.88 TRINITY_DN67675_c2_g1_i10:38-439(+)